jgi:hypothetical protein
MCEGMKTCKHAIVIRKIEGEGVLSVKCKQGSTIKAQEASQERSEIERDTIAELTDIHTD